jgi:hypothetical protein
VAKLQLWGPRILIAAGLLLILGTGAWYLGTARAGNLDYQPGDVVRERPLSTTDQAVETAALPVASSQAVAPRLALPASNLDWGQVAPGDTKTQTIAVRNTGRGPLVISALRSSCRCLAADLSGSTLPPGKVALLTLRLVPEDPPKDGAGFPATVTIESNDPGRPQLGLRVAAEIQSGS